MEAAVLLHREPQVSERQDAFKYFFNTKLEKFKKDIFKLRGKEKVKKNPERTFWLSVMIKGEIMSGKLGLHLYHDGHGPPPKHRLLADETMCM